MQTEKKQFAEPQNLMQAYRIANQTAATAKNADTRIMAYDKVIHYCENKVSCRLDRSIKTNLLLFWAYNNIGDAYLSKGEPLSAISYFEKGIRYARDDKERLSLLEKSAEVYTQLGELSKAAKSREQITGLLEKALQTAGAEEIPLRDKCLNILAVSRRLSAVYALRRDTQNRKRMRNLEKKTATLLNKLEEN